MWINLPITVYYGLLIPVFHALPFGFTQQSAGIPTIAIEWLGWYFLCSFGMSLIFRKLMGMYKI
ncbi:MAG: EMC3/TMCO1 family protein [Methanobacterium sp.]|nr:EMC3/TMCO1 family protein [Methanobacterium sp.]